MTSINPTSYKNLISSQRFDPSLISSQRFDPSLISSQRFDPSLISSQREAKGVEPVIFMAAPGIDDFTLQPEFKLSDANVNPKNSITSSSQQNTLLMLINQLLQLIHKNL
ncbi:hypothetical protein [Thiofilum flexile]|uniref:hypothetical protein n=1 Tax=Thiofilum flexile TaxID=125627 RepID=UPI00035F61CE|nr:hypothetical protein [Thiofilum flexile]